MQFPSHPYVPGGCPAPLHHHLGPRLPPQSPADTHTSSSPTLPAISLCQRQHQAGLNLSCFHPTPRLCQSPGRAHLAETHGTHLALALCRVRFAVTVNVLTHHHIRHLPPPHRDWGVAQGTYWDLHILQRQQKGAGEQVAGQPRVLTVISLPFKTCLPWLPQLQLQFEILLMTLQPACRAGAEAQTYTLGRWYGWEMPKPFHPVGQGGLDVCGTEIQILAFRDIFRLSTQSQVGLLK